MRVSRAKAVHKSGPNKGRLKPGCRFIKNDGAICKTATQMQRRAKKKGRKKKRKRTGAARYARKGVAPRTPAMNRLNEWRRVWRTGNCSQKKRALRMIKKQFQHMAAKPAKVKRGETVATANRRRWKRWTSEYTNKLRQTESYCSGRPVRKTARSPFPPMVDGLGAKPRSRGRKKKHPCATANPPAWCRK